MPHRDLLIRFLLGSPCLVVAYWLFQRAGGGYLGMLTVFPCLAAYAAIIAPSLTSSMASFWRCFYMPERREEPTPYVSRALTLRGRHLPREALAEYETQIVTYPQVLELWTAAIEIAWLDLKDRECARSLHQRALRAMDDPEDWRSLHRVYLQHAKHHPDTDTWFEEEQRQADRRLQVRMRTK